MNLEYEKKDQATDIFHLLLVRGGSKVEDKKKIKYLLLYINSEHLIVGLPHWTEYVHLDYNTSTKQLTYLLNTPLIVIP